MRFVFALLLIVAPSVTWAADPAPPSKEPMVPIPFSLETRLQYFLAAAPSGEAKELHDSLGRFLQAAEQTAQQAQQTASQKDEADKIERLAKRQAEAMKTLPPEAPKKP